jgi:Ran GTPase-activating protein (RanGAP) involved in mRNA processing and transport
MPLNAQLFEQLSNVTSLDLSGQSFTDEDITQLAQALSTNTTLTSLNVSSNQIGVEGAKALSLLFKPAVDIVEPPATEPRLKSEKLCVIL